MGLMVIAPLLYGAFYPQPYLGQILRHLPIAVVDLDQTELSRQLVMALDADAGVQVTVRANTIAQAQQELFQRHVFGILEIPPGTSREFLKGNVARLPAFVDSAYFLRLQPHAPGHRGIGRQRHGRRSCPTVRAAAGRPIGSWP